MNAVIANLFGLGIVLSTLLITLFIIGFNIYLGKYYYLLKAQLQLRYSTQMTQYLRAKKTLDLHQFRSLKIYELMSNNYNAIVAHPWYCYCAGYHIMTTTLDDYFGDLLNNHMRAQKDNSALHASVRSINAQHTNTTH